MWLYGCWLHPPCVYRYFPRFSLQPESFPISLQGCRQNLLKPLYLSAFETSTTYNHHYDMYILLINLTYLIFVKKLCYAHLIPFVKISEFLKYTVGLVNLRVLLTASVDS